MGADRIMTKVFSRKRIILKIIISMCLVLMVMGVSACDFSSKEEQTQITIQKDGSVRMQIIESFDKPYYDKDELQQKVLTEVAGYNRNMGSGNISVEKIEVEDNRAKVVMVYGSCQDYARFNNSVLFVGNTAGAVEEGYDLNTVLSVAGNPTETIGVSDMLLMTDYSLLITDCREPIIIDGKAEYISDNVIISNNKKIITLMQDTDKPAYVLFQ